MSQSLADFRNEIRNSVTDKFSWFKKGKVSQLDIKQVESRVTYQSPDKSNVMPTSRISSSIGIPTRGLSEFSERKNTQVSQISQMPSQAARFKSSMDDNDKHSLTNSPSKLSVQRGIERIGKKNYESQASKQP